MVPGNTAPPSSPVRVAHTPFWTLAQHRRLVVAAAVGAVARVGDDRAARVDHLLVDVVIVVVVVVVVVVHLLPQSTTNRLVPQ